MGVLGWTPGTAWRAATLDDIALAVCAYLSAQGVKQPDAAPARAFLDDMMLKFPDMKKEDDL